MSCKGAEFVRGDVMSSDQSFLLQTILDNFPGGISVVDRDLRMVFANRTMRQMMDLPDSFFAGGPPLLEEIFRFNAVRGEYGPGDVEQHVAARMPVATKMRSPIDYNHQRPTGACHQRPDGTCFDIRFSPVEGGGFVTTYMDITERRQSEARIKYLATHDSLTDLPNRTMFAELLNASIKTAQRYKKKMALLFLDLDRFKVINDTLGHADGDALLLEVASRLRQTLRTSDVVARLGGDEFVVILPEVVDEQEVAVVARKLLSATMKPVMLSGQECRVTASIGVALYPEHGNDEQTLTKNADRAMYLAKEEGKNDFRLFTDDMKTQSIEELMLETNLRNALERDEFVLQYQPKIDLRTGQITGVEALLRWDQPDLGMLQPNQFIPLAEETGLIVPIGRWVLKTACEQHMAWRRDELPPICMAINLSPRQFQHEQLLRDIDDTLATTGMSPELLELEITEGMVMQNVERAIGLLTEIKKRGVRLSMDDFGTGYSSMALIKRFPIDTLKIDRSFIRDLPENTDDKAIADAIIRLGKALRLTIVAEGVETTEQEAFLRDHACDEMQGYLFSRPVSAENIPALLRLPTVVSPDLQPRGANVSLRMKSLT
jgi:diguanylate cyclase (GGDEF)-like protein